MKYRVSYVKFNKRIKKRGETRLGKHKEFISPDFSDDLITTAGHTDLASFLGSSGKERNILS